MLNQRTERHGEEPPKKSEQRQVNAGAEGRMAGIIKKRGEHRHSQRAERDQSVFNFSAGKIPGRNASEPNSNSHSRLQIADMSVVDVQDVVPVDYDHELQQRR